MSSRNSVEPTAQLGRLDSPQPAVELRRFTRLKLEVAGQVGVGQSALGAADRSDGHSCQHSLAPETSPEQWPEDSWPGLLREAADALLPA